MTEVLGSTNVLHMLAHLPPRQAF